MKIKMTPEEVAADLENRGINPVYRNSRKNRNKGVNKAITLITPSLSLDEVWPKRD